MFHKVSTTKNLEKIVITAIDNPTIKEEIQEQTDGDTILKAYAIIVDFIEKGLKPRAEIYYKGKVFRVGFKDA